MCIAVIKEIGVEVPSKKIFKRCFTENPNGAGYGVLRDDGWNCKKGFMSFTAFWKSFRKEHFGTEDYLIIHFRIGTSGKKAHSDFTHPFPVSTDLKELKANTFVSDHVVMHNGVWGKGEKDWSDTMVAIRDYIAPMLPHVIETTSKNDDSLWHALDYILGPTDRWCVVHSDNIWLFGDWIQDKDTKVWYSNTDYEEKTYQYPTNGWYRPSGYDDFSYGTEWQTYAETLEPKEKESIVLDSTEILELYDNDSKLIGLADNTGVVEWAEEEEDCNAECMPEELQQLIAAHGPNKDFDCPMCCANIMISRITNYGECPECGGILLPIEQKDLDKSDFDEICPGCGEEYYIIEPVNGEGESECCKCGAIWNNDTTNTQIVGYRR